MRELYFCRRCCDAVFFDHALKATYHPYYVYSRGIKTAVSLIPAFWQSSEQCSYVGGWLKSSKVYRRLIADEDFLAYYDRTFDRLRISIGIRN